MAKIIESGEAYTMNTVEVFFGVLVFIFFLALLLMFCEDDGK